MTATITVAAQRVETAPQSEQQPLTAVASLQRALPHVIALGAGARQVQRDITGATAAEVRRCAASLAGDADEWANAMCSRIAALGYAADTRATTVTGAGWSIPTTQLRQGEAVGLLLALLDRAAPETAVADSRVHDVAMRVLSGIGAHRRRLIALHDARVRRAEDDEVDQVGLDSFPASDPPSWWTGRP